MINALTFDVEEYFHAEAFAGVVSPEEWCRLPSRVVASTERVLRVLEAAKTLATFFVLGWVAEREPGLVRAIRGLGHEIASHGYGHQMITRLSREQFREDLARGRGAIEAAADVSVIGYRAPTFSVVKETMWSLDLLAEAGFEYDSSIFPIVHDRYGVPDAPRFPHRRVSGEKHSIVEFPLSTIEEGSWRFPVAGGGYFRLLPYSVTRWALERINRRDGQPGIVYLHPWELDEAQPRLPVGPLTQFRHRVNIGSTEAKLRRLLDEFRFAPVRDVLAGSGVIPMGGAV